MITLINYSDSLENNLSFSGLIEFAKQEEWDGDREASVYGCGEFLPGDEYYALVEAHAAGELYGVIGVTLDEKQLPKYAADVREKLGAILKLAPAIYANDELSVEWFLHYGVEAELGGHPAWLARTSRGHGVGDGVVRDLGEAIWGAIYGAPCIYYIELGQMNDAVNRHPLMRFATKFNVRDNVAFGKEELDKKLEMIKELPAVSKELVEAERVFATNTLKKMFAKEEQTDDEVGRALSEAFGESMERKSAIFSGSNSPRVLKVGQKFDPATHYDKDYYQEGNGLLYTKPDGAQELYRGPSRDWHGFDVVAKIMQIIAKGKFPGPLLSLGCGYGNDVRRFVEQGWDAHGVDISEDAVAGAHESVKGRIILADILDAEMLEKLPAKQFPVVVSWDFWEHIWLEDVERLLRAVYEITAPGGMFFNIICTRGVAEQDWTIRKGDTFTQQNSWLLCSGHVTIRRWAWWAKMFIKCGFQICNDLAYLFQVARTEDPGLSQGMSWRARNLLVAGKGE
jgi:SAM-dependent methyltransferase